MKQVTQKLVDSARWNVGKFILSNENSIREYTIVGKEDGEIQLAQRSHDSEGNLEFVVKSYKPGDIFLSGTAGCIVKTTPQRTITTIDNDEYFYRKDPSNELNKRYLEILRR